jgi:3-hydroxy-D-aspartate aldolase
LDALETPALVVDADALERNLRRMARFTAQHGVALRAHAKTHKCPIIGARQIELGAVGLCCQTVHEAEVMVGAGVRDVMVTNQVIGARKIDRLIALSAQARVGVCVDDAGNVSELGAAAARNGITLDVLVEINVGGDKCGVQPGTPALLLAHQVATSQGLRLRGIQAYHGRAQHLREHRDRELAIGRASDLSRATRDLLQADGLDCPVVTGGGTGTFALEADSGVYNEIQAGTYVFMDADYSRNRTADGAPFAEFEQSLFVLTTVISHVSRATAVVDAGLKAIGVDAGLPVVADREGARYVRASDEHGLLDLVACGHPLQLGDKLKLIPGNCDPTVNLYDAYVVVREERVIALWPIAARGPGN